MTKTHSLRKSSALALKALARFDIHDKLGFTLPAVQDDVLACRARQDLGCHPTTTSGADSVLAFHCQYHITNCLCLQCFSLLSP